MAEFVGLVASIVALTELTGKVIGLGSRYISGVKSAEQDMKALNLELVALARVLKTLQDQANRNYSLVELRVPIQECTKQMRELELQLRPKKRRLINRWKWPLNETHTSKVLESIERSKSLFTLALTAEQFYVTLAVEVYTRNADRKLDDIKSSLAAELAIVTKQRALEEERHKVKERAAILEWLYNHSFDDMHCQISSRRHKHTGQWLFREQKFRNWIKDQPDFKLLWGYGIPGAGKTFISSLVIDTLQSTSQQSCSAVAYIYFNYNEKNKQTVPNVLKSLIKQLARKAPRVPDKLQTLHEAYKETQERPSVNELQHVLVAVIETLPRVFFVFDALDECDETNRCKEFLPLFHLLGTRGASVFITGRPYPRDMQESLNANCVTQIQLQAHEEDLRMYIEQKIEDSIHAKYLIQGELREDIVKRLVGCCKGMFLLVHLHIEDLCKYTSVKQIRSALGELDSSLRQEDALNGIYKRALSDIGKQHKSRRILALRTLAWLSWAPEVDKTEALSLAVAVEDGMADCDDIDNESLPDVTMILEVCKGLTIMDENTKRITLAHYSVKEYLVGDPDFISRAGIAIINTCFTIVGLKSLRHYYQILRFKPNWELPWLHAIYHVHDHIRTFDRSLTHGPYLKFLDSPTFSIYYKACWCLGINLGIYKLPSALQRFRPSSFLHAVSIGHVSVVKHYINLGVDFSTPTSSGNTALYIAALEGYEEIVQVLLENHANPHANVSYGETALHVASKQGHVAILSLLLATGADITLGNGVSGNTPLHEAVENGRLESVRFLIDKGAEISIMNQLGNTPLHQASSLGLLDILVILLNRGGDPWRRNYDGSTAFELAVDHGHINIVRYLYTKRGLSLRPGVPGALMLQRISKWCPRALHPLLMSITDPAARGWGGHPPLIYAVRHSFSDAVVHLLEKGADISVKDKNGNTVLHHAAGDADMFRLLLDKGADIAVAGNTLLHRATYKGYLDVVRILLERGSDPSAPDSAEDSPLHMAASRNHSDLVTCLLQFGADPSAKNASGYTPLYHSVFTCAGQDFGYGRSRDLSQIVHTLLPYCDEPSIQDKNGNTVLHIAADKGCLNLANAFLEKGADPSLKNLNGETPLQLALQNGHERIAISLMKSGANLSSINSVGSTPLTIAAGKGSLEVVRALLAAGLEVSAVGNYRRTALHNAVIGGHHDVVLKLLEAGTDLSVQDKDGFTPLHHAIIDSDVDIFSILVRGGADPSLTLPGGRGGIHIAVLAGRLDVVVELLSRGVDASSQDDDGNTALHIAIDCGHLEIARILVYKGADVSIANLENYTAQHLALNSDHIEIFDIIFPHGARPLELTNDGFTALHLCIRFPERVQSLLTQGIDASSRCAEFQRTPLHLAVEEKCLETARILLDEGSELSAVNVGGETPLHLASSNIQMTRLLLDRGADVSARDKRGRTPLHHAISAGVALLLLERGADPSSQSLGGHTPLHDAVNREIPELVRVLLERGASPSAQARDGCTSLHYGFCRYEIAKLLLEGGADPSSGDLCGITPLHLIAFGIGRKFTFVSAKDDGGGDGGAEQPDVFKHQFNKHEDRNRVARVPITLLDGSEGFIQYWIGNRSERIHPNIQLDVVMLLLDSGANPSGRCSSGCTPLHFASQFNKVDIVRALLAKGADPSLVCAHDETPLSIAIRFKRKDVVRALVESGAEALRAVENRSSLLYEAIQGGHEGLARLLLESGVDICGTNDYGLTPLHLAIQAKDIIITNLLLQHDVDISARSPSGLSPLHAAAHSSSGVPMISALLKKGADISELDSVGMTALYHATLADNIRVFNFLIECGAHPATNLLSLEPESFMARLKTLWEILSLDIYEHHSLLVQVGINLSVTMDRASEDSVLEQLENIFLSA